MNLVFFLFLTDLAIIDDKSASSNVPSGRSSIVKLDEDPVKSVYQSKTHLSANVSLKEKMSAIAASLQFLAPGKDNKEDKVLEEQSVFIAGDTFGQRALFNNGRRKATVIAKEPTYLACIDKQHFDLTLSG